MINRRILYFFMSFSFFIISAAFSTGSFMQNDETGLPVKEYELKEPAKQVWYNIKDEWVMNEYPRCVAEKRLRLSCSGCSSVFIRVILTIDHQGKTTGYQKTYEKVCGGKGGIKTEKCFLRFFKNKTFPEELRNKKIETTLGTGLKC